VQGERKFQGNLHGYIYGFHEEGVDAVNATPTAYVFWHDRSGSLGHISMLPMEDQMSRASTKESQDTYSVSYPAMDQLFLMAGTASVGEVLCDIKSKFSSNMTHGTPHSLAQFNE
jgi:hypothetical protein